MCPGRMRNGVSRSAARFGGRASAGCRGGTSATLVVALIYFRHGGRGAKRAPSRRALGHLRARGAGQRAFHPTRLETRTKESNMCASWRVGKTREAQGS